jgi:hypothetical protein
MDVSVRLVTRREISPHAGFGAPPEPLSPLDESTIGERSISAASV